MILSRTLKPNVASSPFNVRSLSYLKSEAVRQNCDIIARSALCSRDHHKKRGPSRDLQSRIITQGSIGRTPTGFSERPQEVILSKKVDGER